MDFSISNEHEAFAKAFDRFCRDKIEPRAKAADENGTLPDETWSDLAEFGYFDLYLSEDGETADWLMRALAEERLAQACASTFLSAGASVGLCGGPIQRFGSAEQKARWIEPLRTAKAIGCFGLTEPGAGSDAAAISCRARPDGDGFVLSGEKALITNAPGADVAVVMAVTDPEAGPRGVTAFVVDLSKPGIERSTHKKLGLRGSPTGGLVFNDVKLEASDVLGEVGMGFVQAMQTLEDGRIAMSHFGIGIAQAAMRSAMAYANDRKAFGRAIARLQAVHFKIADMKIEIDTAQLMARRAAWTRSRGEPCADLASIAKLYATEMAVRVADAAVQIHGGWGYTDDYDAERLLRDARLGPIGEGTSEIQRELIARMLLD